MSSHHRPPQYDGRAQRLDARALGESAAHIAAARFRGKRGLRRRIDDAFKKRWMRAQAKHARQRTRNFPRLVIAARDQPAAGERHGQGEIGQDLLESKKAGWIRVASCCANRGASASLDLNFNAATSVSSGAA